MSDVLESKPARWKIVKISYEKGNATEGVRRRIKEVKVTNGTAMTLRFTREQVVEKISSGTAEFVVARKDAPLVRVVAESQNNSASSPQKHYLRSEANDLHEDNLGELPEYDAATEALAQDLTEK